jgi:hypothetical protein
LYHGREDSSMDNGTTTKNVQKEVGSAKS